MDKNSETSKLFRLLLWTEKNKKLIYGIIVLIFMGVSILFFHLVRNEQAQIATILLIGSMVSGSFLIIAIQEQKICYQCKKKTRPDRKCTFCEKIICPDCSFLVSHSGGIKTLCFTCYGFDIKMQEKENQKYERNGH